MKFPLICPWLEIYFLITPIYLYSQIGKPQNEKLTQFYNNDTTEKIIFATQRDGNGEIYVMNPDGTNQLNLTNNTAEDLDPALSFNGSIIAFESWRDGNGEIYAMNPDGSNQLNLTNNLAEEYDPSFSSDGQNMAFISNRDGNWEVYKMNSNGSNQIRLTNNLSDDRVPSISPDGSKIVFASDRDGNFEIYIMNIDGSQLIRLTNNEAEDYYPSFSPDGLKIAFISFRDGNGEVYLMNVDGSNQINISNSPTSNEMFPCSFSPDGSRITFTSDRDQNYEIYVMNVDGSNQIRLTYNSLIDRQPSWGHWVLNTSVNETRREMPASFSLAQNYPNPFNPSTTISFILPLKSFVYLKVFDIIGREMVVLISEELNAGTHSLQWNAVGMPSGVYFYQLQVGSFSETKKLTLLK